MAYFSKLEKEAAANPGAGLDAELASLRSQINNLSNATGIEGAAARNNLVMRYQQLQAQQRNSQAQAQQTQTRNDAQQKADAARNQMLALGQSGIDRLGNDSTDQMVRQYLQKQMGANTLDPNNTPFGGNVPQYQSQGYKAEGYTPTTGSAQSWQAAQMGAAPQIGGGGPWDETSKRAYMNDANSAAVAGESARNQLIRDALLQSGGNASDPSLAGAYAESLTQRNDAQAKARNQINMRATSENFGAQRQADLANQQANMGQMQYNASNQQQANSSNAGMAQQMGLANMGAQNQAGMFNAQNQTAANQFGASAQNQAGMFNTQNQMQGQLADYNAGTQARIYNNQQQTGAANQLGGYNNQRQNMLTNAQQYQAGLLGQQRFSVPNQQQPQQGFPSFQQFQSAGSGGSNVNYAPGYFQNMDNSRLGFAPSQTLGGGGQRSGTTTTSFSNGYTGQPWNQQATSYVQRPTNRPATPTTPPTMSQLQPMPGVKIPQQFNARDF